MTMVVPTHERSFARDIADRIVSIDGSIIVEEGKPDEVLFTPRTDRVRAFLKRSTTATVSDGSSREASGRQALAML
jgi:ABC-type polar amino acid transport system ATPase subunit